MVRRFYHSVEVKRVGGYGMEKREMHLEKEELIEIGKELKVLALRVSELLLEYKNNGIIEEAEYERLVKIKREFINSL